MADSGKATRGGKGTACGGKANAKAKFKASVKVKAHTAAGETSESPAPATTEAEGAGAPDIGAALAATLEAMGEDAFHSHVVEIAVLVHEAAKRLTTALQWTTIQLNAATHFETLRESKEWGECAELGESYDELCPEDKAHYEVVYNHLVENYCALNSIAVCGDGAVRIDVTSTLYRLSAAAEHGAHSAASPSDST